MADNTHTSYEEIFKKIGQASSVLLQITSDVGEKINGILLTYHDPNSQLFVTRSLHLRRQAPPHPRHLPSFPSSHT